MIFIISDSQFKNIMGNPNFYLPVRWDGHDFEEAISSLLDEYIRELFLQNEKLSLGIGHSDRFGVDIGRVKEVSDLLKCCIREYHQGLPSMAFETMKRIMNSLMEMPLNVYLKSESLELLETTKLNLFRLRGTDDAAKHMRKDLFHVPSRNRSMISTCRYSIAGYPSLYLTTSVELGKEEVGKNCTNLLVSRFKIAQPQQELSIRVLELGIRPQDFYNNDRNERNDYDIRAKGGPGKIRVNDKE